MLSYKYNNLNIVSSSLSSLPPSSSSSSSGNPAPVCSSVDTRDGNRVSGLSSNPRILQKKNDDTRNSGLMAGHPSAGQPLNTEEGKWLVKSPPQHHAEKKRFFFKPSFVIDWLDSEKIKFIR